MIRTVLDDDLPSRVGGFVVEDEDGDYVVVMNARHSREANMETYRHEVEHITGRDFDRSETADEIEAARHKKMTS